MLNQENYFSSVNNLAYMSVSQYNNFVGTPNKSICEAKTMAVLKGKFETKPSTAMLVGSYVDAYFEGTLDRFKSRNPDLFTLKGDLRSDFKQADEIIEWVKKDKFFMDYLVGSGEAQVIVTGEIGGYPWKGKIDRLHRGECIVDGKVVESIRDLIYDKYAKTFVNFIDAYGYVRQAAVYRELWYQMSGEKLPFVIAAVSKEKYPDKEIIMISEADMEMALEEIIRDTPRIVKIKTGILPPVSCGKCDYCRSVKMCDSVIWSSDLYS